MKIAEANWKKGDGVLKLYQNHPEALIFCLLSNAVLELK
jgi:hypothetical protein